MTRIGHTRLSILYMLQGRQRTTIRELAAALGCQISNVHVHLRALRRDGLVTWDRSTCGTLRATCVLIPLPKE